MLDVTARSEGGANPAAFTGALTRQTSAPGLALPFQGFGLAARVLAVTIGFVLLAMGLFYVTRLTAHREMLLHGKISAVETTVDAFGLAGPNPPPHDLSQKILNSVEVKWMAVETPAGRREFVTAGGPLESVEAITADESSYVESMAATFHALFAAPGTVVKLSAPAQANEPAIEFAFDETPLIQSLRRVSYNFLTISLTIAAVVTCVLWAALWRMVLQPVRRLTSNIIAFGESPQDASRVIAPTGRGNEIGRAEAALAVMQAVARPRAGARQAPGGARHGGRAHQSRPAQYPQRRAAHFGSSGDDPRPARPTAGAASGRNPRSRDPVLSVDADLWRKPRASPVAPPLRPERAGEPSRRGGDSANTMWRSTTTSTFLRGSAFTPTRTTCCGCWKT